MINGMRWLLRFAGTIIASPASCLAGGSCCGKKSAHRPVVSGTGARTVGAQRSVNVYFRHFARIIVNRTALRGIADHRINRIGELQPWNLFPAAAEKVEAA